MTEKEIALGFAAKIDQLYVELEAFHKDKRVSMSASHEAGVTMCLLRSASRTMGKFAAKCGG